MLTLKDQADGFYFYIGEDWVLRIRPDGIEARSYRFEDHSATMGKLVHETFKQWLLDSGQLPVFGGETFEEPSTVEIEKLRDRLCRESYPGNLVQRFEVGR